jgi:hypothetical protein
MYCNTFFCKTSIFLLGVLGSLLRGPVNLATWQPLGGLGKPKHSRQPIGQPNAQSAYGIKGKTAPVARWAI